MLQIFVIPELSKIGIKPMKLYFQQDGAMTHICFSEMNLGPTSQELETSYGHPAHPIFQSLISSWEDIRNNVCMRHLGTLQELKQAINLTEELAAIDRGLMQNDQDILQLLCGKCKLLWKNVAKKPLHMPLQPLKVREMKTRRQATACNSEEDPVTRRYSTISRNAGGFAHCTKEVL
ncbi:hypothetical protein C0J52_15364 [Blattella germanica]|nr:hypothetical protein C0J52_15364 [Blattella germanica]